MIGTISDMMESDFCCHHADQVISCQLHNRFNNMNNNNNNSMLSSSSSSLSSSSSIFLPVSSPPPSMLQQTSSLPSSSSPALVGGGGRGGGCIEHAVSKFDTLAGVAIKYGVEVADIKKMNGLVTDRQMFGLRFLQIPPGRHPPSPSLSSGSKTPATGHTSSDQTPPQRTQCDLFESFRSLRVTPPRKPSPAMNTLQSYYGLKPRNQRSVTEGFEMAVYKNGGDHYLENGTFLGASPASDQPLSQHRKSRSLVKLDENSELSDSMPVAETIDGDSDSLGDKLIRRRQKSEADFCRTPETMLGGNGSNGGFSANTGKKGLALRPKSANRAAIGNDVEGGVLNPIPVGLGDSLIAEGFSGVRKSSSTSNLQDHDGNSSSIWSTSKWNLKPDLQAFSTAAITKPIFDGLPKPITGRRKAALD